MTRYVTFKDILQDYPFTKGQLDYFVFNRDKNGLADSIIKIGKRLYFDISLFEVWLKSHKD